MSRTVIMLSVYMGEMAMELGDVQRLSQLEAAAQMGISRQTFGYLLASARQKVATAITQGLVLKLPTPNDKEPV